MKVVIFYNVKRKTSRDVDIKIKKKRPRQVGSPHRKKKKKTAIAHLWLKETPKQLETILILEKLPY